jgi:asparagine synthase (glutamine-hydrolysing)
MCGIGGVIQLDKTSFDIDGLMRNLAHRGPDDVGFASLSFDGASSDSASAPGHVILGHRRLSIIDLSTGGHQPMSTADGGGWLTFNGEIYNYLELRESLQQVGIECVSDSDSEVLLNGVHNFGHAFLDRVVGMYAFCYVNLMNKRAMLCRDHFGMKPLYYYKNKSKLIFASEIGAIREASRVRQNAQQIFEFLRFGFSDDGEETIYSELRSVPIGGRISVDLTTLNCTDCGQNQLNNGAQVDSGEAKQLVRQFRELLLDSVALHLRSDVPVAIALSGGLDSSSILGCARAASPERTFRAYTYVADDRQLDESAWAEMAAKSAGAELVKVEIAADELRGRIDSIIASQGEPFGSLSVAAQYFLYDRVKQDGLKVILEGQGADELLGGYVHYVGPRVGTALRSGRVVDAVRVFLNAPRTTATPMPVVSAHVFQDLVPWSVTVTARKFVGRAIHPAWIRTDWLEHHRIDTGRWHRLRRKAGFSHVLENAVRHSLPHLLRYADRNSMASSVESRLPFLIDSIAAFTRALPDDLLFGSNGYTKWILREAMRGLVPDEILYRRNKLGFAPPHRKWLTLLSPWVEDVIRERRHEAIDSKALRSAWARFLRGEPMDTALLWRPINLLASSG